MVAWRSSVPRNVQNIPEQRERLLLQLNQLKQKSGAKSRADDIRRVSAQIKALDDELARRMHTVPEVQKAKVEVNRRKKVRTTTTTTGRLSLCHNPPRLTRACAPACLLCCQARTRNHKIKVGAREEAFERKIDEKLLESNAFVRRPNRPGVLWAGDCACPLPPVLRVWLVRGPWLMRSSVHLQWMQACWTVRRMTCRPSPTHPSLTRRNPRRPARPPSLPLLVRTVCTHVARNGVLTPCGCWFASIAAPVQRLDLDLDDVGANDGDNKPGTPAFLPEQALDFDIAVGTHPACAGAAPVRCARTDVCAPG